MRNVSETRPIEDSRGILKREVYCAVFIVASAKYSIIPLSY